MLVATELAAECKRKKTTQKEVAAAAGIGAEQFSYYIRGDRGLLSVGVLLRAAEKLRVSPQEIVERAYAALLVLEPDAPQAGIASLDDAVELKSRARQKRQG